MTITSSAHYLEEQEKRWRTVLNRCLIDSHTNQRIQCQTSAYMAISMSPLPHGLCSQSTHSPWARFRPVDHNWETFWNQRLQLINAALQDATGGRA